MEIEFSIGGLPARLKRGWFLGGVKIETPNEVVWLQHPAQFGTHFSFQLEQAWDRSVGGHSVRVEKVRPLLMAGVRPQTFRIYVDGNLVAGASGY